MAYPNSLIKLTYRFGLYIGADRIEQAEPSLWWVADPAHIPPDWDAALLDFAQFSNDAWQSNMSTAYWESSVVLDSVLATQYDTTLHTAHEQVYVDASPFTGNQTTGSLPWQTSLCLSLYTYTPGTFIANARRRRGRFYMPPMSASVLTASPDGAVSTSIMNDVMGSMNSIIGAIANHDLVGTSIPPVPGVLSRVDEHLYDLTDFAIDPILDTQRRRTKSIVRPRTALEFTH